MHSKLSCSKFLNLLQLPSKTSTFRFPSPVRNDKNQNLRHRELGPATSTPEADGARGLPQRTYQSLKDMISSRFAKQNGNSVQTPTSSNLDASLSPQSQLRQHGVYIGSPQPSQQQQQPVVSFTVIISFQRQQGQSSSGF